MTVYIYFISLSKLVFRVNSILILIHKNPIMSQNKQKSIPAFDEEGFRLRAACVCVRSDYENEVLLVTTSHRRNRWVVPGGGLEPEEEASAGATRIALQKGGVLGELGRKLGVFYNGERKEKTEVYVLKVTEELNQWDDYLNIKRKRQWFSLKEAIKQQLRTKQQQQQYLQQLYSAKFLT